MRGVCKVPSCLENEWGTPGPCEPLPSRRCWWRKVPACPQSPEPWGRGEAFQKDKIVLIHKTNLQTRTYTDTQINGRPLPISLTLPSLKRGPQRGQHSGAAEAEGSPCRPAARSLPGALGACGLRGVLGAGSSPARTSGRPMLNLQPARGRELRRPRWLCSKGSCLSAPPYRRRSARARRLPDLSPRPRLPPRRPAGFSVGVPRSWSRRC